MSDEKNTDKKKDLKSLLIYLALSFGLAWIWFLIFIRPGETWDSIGGYMQSFVALGMLFPFIANMLTRKITKEGYSLKGDAHATITLPENLMVSSYRRRALLSNVRF